MKIQFKALSSNSPNLFPEDIFAKIAANHEAGWVNQVVDDLNLDQTIKLYKGGGTTAITPTSLSRFFFTRI